MPSQRSMTAHYSAPRKRAGHARTGSLAPHALPGELSRSMRRSGTAAQCPGCVAVAPVAGAGPVRHMPAAVRLDAKLAASHQAAGRGRAGSERPGRTTRFPVRRPPRNRRRHGRFGRPLRPPPEPARGLFILTGQMSGDVPAAVPVQRHDAVTEDRDAMGHLHKGQCVITHAPSELPYRRHDSASTLVTSRASMEGRRAGYAPVTQARACQAA
jgi:hypothetical protein